MVAALLDLQRRSNTCPHAATRPLCWPPARALVSLPARFRPHHLIMSRHSLWGLLRKPHMSKQWGELQRGCLMNERPLVSDIEAVRAALRDFADAFRKLDFERFTCCFGQDEVSSAYFPFPDRPLLHQGWNAQEHAWRDVFEAERRRAKDGRILLKIDSLAIQILGDVAIVTFLVNSELPTIVHRRTVIMARQSGTWRIVHLHASNVDPPDEGTA